MKKYASETLYLYTDWMQQMYFYYYYTEGQTPAAQTEAANVSTFVEFR